MMKNRRIIYYPFVLLAGFMLVMGCSGGDSLSDSPEVPLQPTWRVTIDANSAEEGGSTRALSLGADGKLYTFWTNDDQVKAVSGTTEAGILTATLPDTDYKTLAKLTGTISGTYAEGDILTLWYPDYEMNYDEQTGTLTGISTSNTFLTAESEVLAVDAANSVLQMSDASFCHLQAFLNLTFTNTESTPLVITKLEIWTDGGKLVKSKRFDETSYANAASPLAVTPSPACSQFFLSLRDEQGAAAKYHFLATTSTGDSYCGTANSNLLAGHYYRGTLKLSPSTIDREGYGNGNGWDSDGSGSIDRDGYDNGISWDDLGTVQTNRDGYGLGVGWDSDVSNDTDRGNYGDSNNWDGSTSGNTDRGNYGDVNGWDEDGSGNIGRNKYGNSTSW